MFPLFPSHICPGLPSTSQYSTSVNHWLFHQTPLQLHLCVDPGIQAPWTQLFFLQSSGLIYDFCFPTIEPIHLLLSFKNNSKIPSPLKVLFFIFQHLLVCISSLNLHILTDTHTHTHTHTHRHTHTGAFRRCGVGGRVEAYVQSIIPIQPPYIELKKIFFIML